MQIKKSLIFYNEKLYKNIEDKDIKIPLDLKIENNEYHYKYHNTTKTKYVYRCKYANICKVYIKFEISFLKKLMDNNCDENTIIEYSNINNKIHAYENNNVYIN